jgi:hypothetical protein
VYCHPETGAAVRAGERRLQAGLDAQEAAVSPTGQCPQQLVQLALTLAGRAHGVHLLNGVEDAHGIGLFAALTVPTG